MNHKAIKSDLITLGIETSCDETGVGIYSEQSGLMAHTLHSQIDVHKEYGGVVPELASRDHIRYLTVLIEEALKQAQINLSAVGGIAYTAGPGLAGALLAGASVARSLAWGLSIPALAVHHMEGHLLAPFLEPEKPSFPFLSLLVSGGHTMLIRAEKLGVYELLGDTADDAVGEAFDKTAKLLGLAYPGGKALSELAKAGDRTRFKFPLPMVNRPGLDFSFSGLKTFARNTIANHPDARADIAAAFETSAVTTLMIKCKRALEQTGLKTLIVSGGVSANEYLRAQLTQYAKQTNSRVFFPRLSLCTDNGAMIALAGHLRLQAGHCQQDAQINIQPKWDLCSLPPV